MQNSSHSTANRANIQLVGEPVHIGDGPAAIVVRGWPGNGPDALLIHGIGSSSASWNSLIELLQTVVSPIAIDLRGHGDSGRPARGYLYDDYGADLDRTIAALGLHQPVLIGHSLGGIVALWWAAQNPDAARAIVAVDTPLRSGEHFRPAFDGWIAQNAMPVAELAAQYRERNPDWTAERTMRRATAMTSTAPAVFSELKADSMANHGTDRIAEITSIRSPVLLVHGDPESGSTVHPQDRNDLVQRLPNARLAHIAGAGHALHRERPAEFVAAVASFLHEVNAVASRPDHG